MVVVVVVGTTAPRLLLVLLVASLRPWRSRDDNEGDKEDDAVKADAAPASKAGRMTTSTRLAIVTRR